MKDDNGHLLVHAENEKRRGMKMTHQSIESIIKKGQIWIHKKTGKMIQINSQPENKYSRVEIIHPSGRITEKQQHYFLYEYKLS